jgi:tetratricopeptide (TPR) repeat protein
MSRAGQRGRVPVMPPTQRASGQNRVHALIERLAAEDRFGDLEAELERLDRNDLSRAEHEAWWENYGIAAFRAGRDADALKRFEEAHARFPQSAMIRFCLGQQYERAREIDKAFALFEQTGFPKIPASHALTQARYAYLWDRYDQGRSYLWPIFRVYREVGSLDDTYLFMRGLPFFSECWEVLAAFSLLADDWREIEAVGREFAGKDMDYDIADLVAALDVYRRDDLAAAAAELEQRLARTPSHFPSSTTRTRLAIVRSRLASRRDEAEAALAAVDPSKDDFPWLADMRLLARAEIELRFGSAETEREAQRQFIARQPLLFEPSNALNFHLLRYQERLKPLYRAAAVRPMAS